MAGFERHPRPAETGAGEPRLAAEFLGDLLGRVEEIVRSEVRVASSEMRDKAREAAAGGAALAAGGVAAIYAGGFVLSLVHRGLSKVFGESLSSLLLGTGLGYVAISMFGEGLRTLRRIEPKPERTLRTVKRGIKSAIEG